VGVKTEGDCPYCLAIAHPWPAVDTTLVLLSGYDAGRSGTVVDDVWGTCPRDRFLVQMSDDPAGTLRMVLPSRGLYLDARRLIVPDWMPPLSIRDNADLHTHLIDSLPTLISARNVNAFRSSFQSLILQCWHSRMPVSGEEIWSFVKAHQLGPRFRKRAISDFEFGMRLLTQAAGRPPIKRRRMAPMSQGSYIPPRLRAIFDAP